MGLALSQPAAQRGAHRCSGDSSAAGEIPSLDHFVINFNFNTSLEIFVTTNFDSSLGKFRVGPIIRK